MTWDIPGLQLSTHDLLTLRTEIVNYVQFTSNVYMYFFIYVAILLAFAIVFNTSMILLIYITIKKSITPTIITTPIPTTKYALLNAEADDDDNDDELEFIELYNRK